MEIDIMEQPIRFRPYGLSSVVGDQSYGEVGCRLMDEMWRVATEAKLKTTGINHWVYFAGDRVFVGVEVRDADGPTIPGPLQPCLLWLNDRQPELAGKSVKDLGILRVLFCWFFFVSGGNTMASTILVVDDSPIQRVLVERVLGKNPEYRVHLAENGIEALEAIAETAPDLVVTDLVMPDMNGLELVQTMRRRYPRIPVILITAFGDESTAVEALEAGAASYVPKSQKAERLMSAVERVLESAAANQSREQLAQCMLEYHCRFALMNDRGLIRALAGQIQQAMAGTGFGDTVERIRVSEALEEALLNAMYHGNLELSNDELAAARAELDDHILDRIVEERCRKSHISDRRILVVAHITKNEARLVVRDEGQGFNIASVANDPTSDRFASGQSRGITIIRALMDEVTFNKTGNELVMRKRVRDASA